MVPFYNLMTVGYVERKLCTAIAIFGRDYILTALEVRLHHWPSKLRWLKK